MLDGATSQWKRAVVSSAAIGPAAGSPGGDALDRGEVPARGVEVELRPERPRPLLVEPRPRADEVERPAEDDDADVEPLAALDVAARGAGSRTRTAQPRADSASSTNPRGASSRRDR